MPFFQPRRKKEAVPVDREKIDQALTEPGGGVDEFGLEEVAFATDAQGSFKFLVLVLVVFVLAILPLTVAAVSTNVDLRSRAAGTAVGNRLFCGGVDLCPDGHCEGDTWRECAECPPGTAKAVVEVTCGVYQRSECVLEAVNCVDSSP